ncbi:MAG: hypothetical protein LBG27_10125 [Spirochaetaceae bacterium]|jgi:hypothetical protein|nr:hypothetical protein [Spirochaetaceae bacterium]
MKEMKSRKDKPKDLTDFLLDTMELVADLDVNSPNLMKELAKAKVVVEYADKAIKNNLYRLALRNFNNKTMQIEQKIESKPLRLLSR